MWKSFAVRSSSALYPAIRQTNRPSCQSILKDFFDFVVLLSFSIRVTLLFYILISIVKLLLLLLRLLLLLLLQSSSISFAANKKCLFDGWLWAIFITFILLLWKWVQLQMKWVFCCPNSTNCNLNKGWLFSLRCHTAHWNRLNDSSATDNGMAVKWSIEVMVGCIK